MQLLIDATIVFLLGVLGWGLFSLLRLPMPALLGTIAVVGGLQVVGVGLPEPPGFVFPLTQVILGYYVGSRVTRDTVRQLRTMMAPALIIVAWTLGVVFVLGSFLSAVTALDPFTALLSSAMGGLPEMTVIGLATGANIAFIIVMQSVRMFVTVLSAPLLLRYWFAGRPIPRTKSPVRRPREFIAGIRQAVGWRPTRPAEPSRILEVIIVAATAAGGAVVFSAAGVPAGSMVGSMLAVAVLSVAWKPVPHLPSAAFGLLLVGVGLMVAGSMTGDTLQAVWSPRFILPIVLSTIVIMASSILVTFLIRRVTGWDLATCFLAAAPGGFTVMTGMAVSLGRDPFRVAMLHLLRLLAIKTVVPLVFMLFVS